MRAGIYRHRVIFQRPTFTQDSIGGPTDTWAELDTVNANVTWITGREQYRDGTIDKQPTSIECYQGSEIRSLNTEDRVLVPMGYTETTSAVTSASTTLKVSSAAEFPPAVTPSGTENVYRVRIANELLTVTDGHGTTTWTVTRGTDGTTATSHVATIPVILMQPLDIESVEPLGRTVEVMAVKHA